MPFNLPLPPPLPTSPQVDLNLIVDYHWPDILPELPAFVRQVPKPSDLCDLLFALRPGRCVRKGEGVIAWMSLSALCDMLIALHPGRCVCARV